ncbi:serine/threonine protein kinase [Vogesella sp. GCM10023246]|uniref:non-specific serine/threonine protein kinase n=1 Tax=Vogesella oryzagri TaxID=3160864 RepID=A0ABV1M6A5_9NEIS
MDSTQSKSRSLVPGSRLEEYTIVRVLSSGGFSEVYLALDGHDRKYAIKEYLPRDMVGRSDVGDVTVLNELDREVFKLGLKCFFEEARVLAGIHHPNVVRVSNFFRANQTVYMVMEYADGRSLARELELSDGCMPEARLRKLFAELIAGLDEVHKQHLLHLDIKPGNIYLRRNGTPMLLDFGTARQGAHEIHFAAAMITPGFAAPEQYNNGEPLGVWTDIYGLGASMYLTMGGSRLPAANLRLRQDTLPPATQLFAGKYSPQLLQLVEQCLALAPAARPGSLGLLRAQLLASYQEVAPPTGRRWQRWLACLGGKKSR